MQEECGACFPSFLLQPLLKVGAGEPLGSTDSSALCSQKFHELPWDMNHTLGLEKPQNQTDRGLGLAHRGGGLWGLFQRLPGPSHFLLHLGVATRAGKLWTGLSHRSTFPETGFSPFTISDHKRGC